MVDEAATDRPEEVEVMRKKNQFELRIIRYVHQVLNDGVFVAIVKRIGNVVHNEKCFLIRLNSDMNIEEYV